MKKVFLVLIIGLFTVFLVDCNESEITKVDNNEENAKGDQNESEIDEDHTYTTTILLDSVKNSLVGSIEAGGTLRGEIPFDVPNSDSDELSYSNPFKSGKAICGLGNT